MAFPNIWKTIDPSLFLIAFVVAIVSGILQYFNQKPKRESLWPDFANKSLAFESLENHSNEFKKEIISLCHGKIHVAIGFGLANAILIEGHETCVLIDTLESREAVIDVFDQFQKLIVNKPIEAIILTQFSLAHPLAIEVVTKTYPNVKVFAHDSCMNRMNTPFAERAELKKIRTKFQFGLDLNDDEFANNGIGPKLLAQELGAGCIRPTHLFKKKLKVILAGIELELHHAPGASDDQIVIWWPEEKVLFPAGNIYKAFPNICPINGSSPRDVLSWVKTLDFMAELRPEIMVPGHSRPMEGVEKVIDTLIAYKDAISIVHDQTVRFMNKGFYPNEIARIVKLPPHLSSHPFLKEFYGTVEWTVRAVFTFYMGWFSGKASELHPLSLKEESNCLLHLAGSPSNLEEKMKEAYYTGKYQWGLQLAEAMIGTGHSVSLAKTVKANCLRQLALSETSACGRNWYITEALHTEGLASIDLKRLVKDRIFSSDLHQLLSDMTFHLDYEKSIEVTLTAFINFTEENACFVLKIRRGVLEVIEVIEADETVDMEVATTSKIWREILTQDISITDAVKVGQLKCKPRVNSLKDLLCLFDYDL